MKWWQKIQSGFSLCNTGWWFADPQSSDSRMKLSHIMLMVVIPYMYIYFTYHLPRVLILTFLFLRDNRSSNHKRAIKYHFLVGLQDCWSHLNVSRYEYFEGRYLQGVVLLFQSKNLYNQCVCEIGWCPWFKNVDYTSICRHPCLFRPQCVIVAYSQDWCASASAASVQLQSTHNFIDQDRRV